MNLYENMVRERKREKMVLCRLSFASKIDSKQFNANPNDDMRKIVTKWQAMDENDKEAQKRRTVNGTRQQQQQQIRIS